MTARKPTEKRPSADDRQRVTDARHTFGIRAIAARAGVSEGAVVRVIAGEAVKAATLSVVVRAADELTAERSRRMQPSDTRGAA
jgi:hypothetical protein